MAPRFGCSRASAVPPRTDDERSAPRLLRAGGLARERQIGDRHAAPVLGRPLDEPAVLRNVQRHGLTDRQRHGLARVGVDGVLAVLAIPVGDGRVLVHLLDDLPPADAGVVGAEGDLAHLRRVRDDAHLGAAEVVGPEILEPHAGDEHQQPLVVLPVAVLAARRAGRPAARRSACRTCAPDRSAGSPRGAAPGE